MKTSQLLKAMAQANRQAAVKFNNPDYARYADRLDDEAVCREASEIVEDSHE